MTENSRGFDYGGMLDSTTVTFPFKPVDRPQGVNPFEKVVVDPDSGGRKGQKVTQFSQIPTDILWELATHYGVGMAKYPDDEDGRPNWQRGYNWRLSVDAAMRHFMLWLQGEELDPETGTSHLVCAIWHLFALRYFEKQGKGTDFR